MAEREQTRRVVPPHGYDDDEETRRLLRARPPLAALRWVEEVTGTAVLRARALRGGRSSAVHMLHLRTAQGAPLRLVLRRYVRAEVEAEEPDIAEHEARALRFVEALPIPTPRLVAYDPTGEAAGTRSVLATVVAGRVEWWPLDVDRWLRGLAAQLPVVHESQLPPPGEFPPYAPYEPEDWGPPPWLSRPALWEQALKVFHGPAPDLPAVFIHRDFHPGNVLWRRGRVSGLVDWESAALGPAVVDVAHCRVNLLGQGGLAEADRFTDAWQRLSGLTHHPWADVVTIVDMLGGAAPSRPRAGKDFERALARALAELGPPRAAGVRRW